jgi:hypothetical protein
MLVALIFAFPSTMMEMTYNFGMNGACAWFAERVYRRSDNVYYLYVALNAAFESDDAEAIDRYGSQMIADENFSAFCAAMDVEVPIEGGASGGYEQYICGIVYAAKYRLGDFAGALSGAVEAVKNTFPKKNALVTLMSAVLQKGNADEIGSVLEQMRGIRSGAEGKFSEEEIAYLDSLIDLLGERMDKLS